MYVERRGCHSIETRLTELRMKNKAFAVSVLFCFISNIEKLSFRGYCFLSVVIVIINNYQRKTYK